MQLYKEYIPDAYAFAKEKHDSTNAIRKSSGLPYIHHPEDVADIAVAYGGSDEEIEAALLHDTLEDTNTTFTELKNRYGLKVAKIVRELTNNAEDILKFGKEDYMSHKLVNLSKSALFCKLCDFYDNITDNPTEPQKQRMINNILYLLKNRDLEEREAELVESILMTISEE